MENPTRPKHTRSEIYLSVLSATAMVFGFVLCSYGIWLIMPVIGVSTTAVVLFGMTFIAIGYLLNPCKEPTE